MGGEEKPFPSICSLLFPSESDHKTAEQQVRGKRTNENGHISYAKKKTSGVEITNSDNAYWRFVGYENNW